MSRPRFILAPEQIQSRTVMLSGQDARHCHSLRLRVNDNVLVSDGCRKEYLARIVGFKKNTVELELLEEIRRHSESPLSITLYQGFATGSKLDWVIQKTTELGVTRLVPMLTRFSQMKFKTDRKNRLKRWHEIARQAVRQSGRTQMPEIAEPRLFADTFSDMPASSLGLILHSDVSQCEGWKDRLASVSDCRQILLWVGPEGGFAQEEMDLAHAKGVVSVHLGPRVLRSETAGIVAVALAQFLWGDLGF